MVFDAIVLAGGRSSRLGGTPKAGLVVDGRTLLDSTVEAAVAAGAHRVAVVGDPDVAAVRASAVRGLIVTREDPPFGGPAAGIAAGLEALRTARSSGPDESAGSADAGADQRQAVLVLACDVPRVESAVRTVVSAWLAAVDAAPEVDGVVAVDADGRRQHLLGVYSTAGLGARAQRHRDDGDLDGLPVRVLVEGLRLEGMEVPPGTTDDVDTWLDAARHGIQQPTPVQAAPVQPTTVQAIEGDRMSTDDDQQKQLAEWSFLLAEELGLAEFEVDIDEVLGLAGVAAHAVVRPAAPLTTFIVGYAAGLAAAGGTDARATVSHASTVAKRLAASYRDATAGAQQAGANGGGTDADARGGTTSADADGAGAASVSPPGE